MTMPGTTRSLEAVPFGCGYSPRESRLKGESTPAVQPDARPMTTLVERQKRLIAAALAASHDGSLIHRERRRSSEFRAKSSSPKSKP
jgi:hypothetical protein